MKILLSSLQVSTTGSKGHFNPALQLALALKKQHHEVAVLPLPSPLRANESEQLTQNDIAYLAPPSLPAGLPKSASALATLAKDPETCHQAYHSFLIAPLASQFDPVKYQVATYAPDVIVYDLLAYAAPLAGRLLWHS